MTYKGNGATEGGGAVFSFASSRIRFDENSKVTFSDNQAKIGKAMLFALYYFIETQQRIIMLLKEKLLHMFFVTSSIIFNENSKVTFSDNMLKKEE